MTAQTKTAMVRMYPTMAQKLWRFRRAAGEGGMEKNAAP